jgi:hypothetical protein
VYGDEGFELKKVKEENLEVLLIPPLNVAMFDWRGM